MERFAGCVAVVTGASSGIGAAIAEDLVENGMLVVGIARRTQRVEDLAKKLTEAGYPGRLYPLHADLSVAKQVVEAYKYITDNYGGITVLVNSAGIFSMKSLQDTDTDTITQLMNTNSTNVAIGCREAINNMKKHNITEGHIININSDSGHHVNYAKGMNFGLYCASKFALTALCEGLRHELSELEGFRIRVTSLSPGSVATEMLPEEFVNFVGGPGSDQLLKVTDVSRAVIFAISSPPAVEIVELTIRPTGEII